MTLLSRNSLKSVLFLLPLSLPLTVGAQARSTASRSADISVFAGGQFANPAFGPQNSGGVAFGLDYTRYIQRLPVDFSLRTPRQLQ